MMRFSWLRVDTGKRFVAEKQKGRSQLGAPLNAIRTGPAKISRGGFYNIFRETVKCVVVVALKTIRPDFYPSISFCLKFSRIFHLGSS